MIGQLSGRVAENNPPELLLIVNQVGYELLLPTPMLSALPPAPALVTLWTHLVMRDEYQQLYGFTDKLSRMIFRILLKVNGIGPKAALSILSHLEAVELCEAATNQQIAPFLSIPGIGKKTAGRLLLEVQEPLLALRRSDLWQPTLPAAISAAESIAIKEAETALEQLGCKRKEAQQWVRLAAEAGGNQSSEELLRNALKQLARERFQ